MKRMILATLIAACCLTALAEDPFQAEVNRQKQAEHDDKAKVQSDHRQKQLADAAEPDAETAAKMTARKWRGNWQLVTDDGNVSETNGVYELNAKLVRVCREQKHGQRWTYTRVEIQTADGRLLANWFPRVHPEDRRYLQAFLAHWEKKHGEKAKP